MVRLAGMDVDNGGTDIEQFLDRIDMHLGVGADGPVSQHLFGGIRLRGTLDLNGIGLIDSAGGESPKRRGACRSVGLRAQRRR